MEEEDCFEDFNQHEDEDRIIKTTMFLDRRIEEETSFLRRNKKKLNDLRNKVEKAEEELAALREENDQMEEECKDIDINKITFEGDFFQQLRALEDVQEYETAITGALKTCAADLQHTMHLNNVKISSLDAQNESIKKKIIMAETQLKNKKIDLSLLYDEETKLEDEENILKNDLIAIKDATREKADEIKQLAKTTVDDIYTQREVLLEEVSNLKKELESLEECKKKEQRTSFITHKKIKESIQKQSSTSWISERISLVAKVKKARQDLLNLSRRQPSQSTKRNIRFTQPTIDDDDIKKALVLEINEIKGADVKFLEESIKTEKENNEKLMKEIEKLNSTIESIEIATEGADSFFSEQNDINKNSRRIELLQQELKQLKSLL